MALGVCLRVLELERVCPGLTGTSCLSHSWDPARPSPGEGQDWWAGLC